MKKLFFKQYFTLTLKHIVSSQFISANRDKIVRIKHIWAVNNNGTKRDKLIHYSYIWFITRQLPANRTFLHAITSRMGARTIEKKPILVVLKKRERYFFLQRMIRDNISKNRDWYRIVWTFYQHCVQVIIPQVMFTNRTQFLQAKNNYFSPMSLQLRFKFSESSTAFEKLFLLRALKILGTQKVKKLEEIEDPLWSKKNI